MAKRPRPGLTKTRLVPELGAEGASLLYEAFLLDTVELTSRIVGVARAVAIDEAESRSYFERVAPDCDQFLQRGPDLAARLSGVMTAASDAGFHQVVAIGSDSPTLPPALVAEAFDRLDGPDTDVVIGPSTDGGYYLIGWSKPHPELVLPVEMSTESVLSDTLALADISGVRVVLLEPWHDVDTGADLLALRADLATDRHIATHTRAALEAHDQL